MIDYKKIKDDFKQLRDEILATVRHPDRIFKLMKNYDKTEVYNTYFYFFIFKDIHINSLNIKK